MMKTKKSRLLEQKGAYRLETLLSIRRNSVSNEESSSISSAFSSFPGPFFCATNISPIQYIYENVQPEGQSISLCESEILPIVEYLTLIPKEAYVILKDGKMAKMTNKFDQLWQILDYSIYDDYPEYTIEIRQIKSGSDFDKIYC